MSGMPIRKRLKYTAIYWAVLSTIFISRLMPRTWWLSLFGWIGKIVYRFPSRYKDLVIHHLGLAFGKEKSSEEILALSKEVYVMLAKNGADVIRSWSVETLEQPRNLSRSRARSTQTGHWLKAKASFISLDILVHLVR